MLARPSQHLTRRQQFAIAISDFAAPRITGLPNWRVVAIFPAVLAVVTIVLVMLHISGTSSGVHWFNLGTGSDPRLLLGTPQPIRSDEYLVQQSWVVSQSHQGWPATNPIFPGGVDMTVLNELPSWDWSTLFRPHLWGYLVAGLAAGISWEWWLPAFGMVSACYLFLVTINPRRWATAALVSISLFFTPLVQWWYGPSTMWPVAWALLAMAGTVWCLRDRRRWVRFLFAGGVGYLAVTMAMGLYVPYIVPAVLVFLFFTVGYLFRVRPWHDGGFKLTAGLIAPYAVAGLAAIAVSALWALLHLATFRAIFSTVYPGQRSEPTGGLLTVDPYLTSLAGAPWNSALKATSAETILGVNSSEASSVILLSLFLLPGLVWFAVAAYRRSRRPDWLLLACVACFVLVVAYLLVPGWDAVAHVLQLDRVPARRFKIIFVVLLPVFVALTIEYVDKTTKRSSMMVGALCGTVAVAVMACVWFTIKTLDPTTIGLAARWQFAVLAIIAATFLLFVRNTVPVAAAALLVGSLLIGWSVNPVYRGVYDLSETAVGSAVKEVNAAQPGTWVGVGSNETMAVLVQSGVSSFSGVQNYPSKTMWKDIDPAGRFEDKWNRLAHIQWKLERGALTIGNPQEDVIVVTVDPCSTLAQKHIDYVLADESVGTEACLDEQVVIHQGSRTMRILKVVPPTVLGSKE